MYHLDNLDFPFLLYKENRHHDFGYLTRPKEMYPPFSDSLLESIFFVFASQSFPSLKGISDLLEVAIFEGDHGGRGYSQGALDLYP